MQTGASRSDWRRTERPASRARRSAHVDWIAVGPLPKPGSARGARRLGGYICVFPRSRWRDHPGRALRRRSKVLTALRLAREERAQRISGRASRGLRHPSRRSPTGAPTVTPDAVARPIVGGRVPLLGPGCRSPLQPSRATVESSLLLRHAQGAEREDSAVFDGTAGVFPFT